MRIILDTSALYYPRAVATIERTGRTIVLPSIVFLERARQLQRDGHDGIALMRRFAEAEEAQIEPYGMVETLRTLRLRVHADPAWRRSSRDAMIAGHVGEGDVLWTADRRDFAALGLRPAQILDVAKL
ncbi:MAG: hypothetical protein QOE90_3308 [Thermoplasmata archaeon]|jgi:predicted nucleic acid-binding protein|nr:hypothetical protein [Thermoplasmata archaeon]